MSIELMDMMGHLGREYRQARANGSEADARRVVHHYSEISGLPTNAAESMIDQFSRHQPLY